ncbi:MAG: anti-sigma factor domain-containing protein [Acidimicrobiales bacterium]
MTTHDEAAELLAPMALDALEADVQVRVEEHVLTCSECQRELDGLREVASALGNTYEVPPEGLWSQIATRLYETDPEHAPSPPVFIGDFDASRSGTRHGARRRSILLTVSLAAAAAIIVLGLNLADANGRVTNLENALASSSHNGVASALATPGHQVVTLSDTSHRVLASFVLLPDGRGYLVHSDMATLPSSETYQLWGIVDGSPVSIGVMGATPRAVAFTLASSPRPTSLAITVESAGGSLTPAKSLVASGEV